MAPSTRSGKLIASDEPAIQQTHRGSTAATSQASASRADAPGPSSQSSMLAVTAPSSDSGEASRGEASAAHINSTPPAQPGEPVATNSANGTHQSPALLQAPGHWVDEWRIDHHSAPPGSVLYSLAISHDMPFYTGGWIITKQVWDLRNDILRNIRQLENRVIKEPLHYRTWSAFFDGQGKMLASCPLLRYFRDLRLFSGELWDVLTLTAGDSRARLQVFSGQQVVEWRVKPNSMV